MLRLEKQEPNFTVKKQQIIKKTNKHHFGMINRIDLNFGAGGCDQGPKEKLMNITSFFLFFSNLFSRKDWQELLPNVAERLNLCLGSSSTSWLRYIIVDESKSSCLWAGGTTDPLEAMLNVVSPWMGYLEGEENRRTPN